MSHGKETLCSNTKFYWRDETQDQRNQSGVWHNAKSPKKSIRCRTQNRANRAESDSKQLRKNSSKTDTSIRMPSCELPSVIKLQGAPIRTWTFFFFKIVLFCLYIVKINDFSYSKLPSAPCRFWLDWNTVNQFPCTWPNESQKVVWFATNKQLTVHHFILNASVRWVPDAVERRNFLLV